MFLLQGLADWVSEMAGLGRRSVRFPTGSRCLLVPHFHSSVSQPHQYRLRFRPVPPAHRLALQSFAAFKPLSVSDQTPAVFLHQPQPPPASANVIPPRVLSPSSSLHPPPPLSLFSPSPTMASSKLPHILYVSSISSLKTTDASSSNSPTAAETTPEPEIKFQSRFSNGLPGEFDLFQHSFLGFVCVELGKFPPSFSSRL